MGAVAAGQGAKKQLDNSWTHKDFDLNEPNRTNGFSVVHVYSSSLHVVVR